MYRQLSSRMIMLLLTGVVFLVQPSATYSQRRETRRHERRHAAVIANLPREHAKIVLKGHEYYYSRGIFYQAGPHGFVVMTGPVGARLKILPAGYQIIRPGFFLYFGTYYQYDPVAKEYVVINPPAAAADTAEAPPSFDRIDLVDGQSMEGTFIGGTSSIVQFEVDGEIKEIPIEQVISIVFAPPAP